MKLLVVIILIFTIITVALNIKATTFVLQSDTHNRFQKIAQIAFVWLFPLIGAVVTKEIHSPKYIKRKEPWAEHGYHGQGSGEDGVHLLD